MRGKENVYQEWNMLCREDGEIDIAAEAVYEDSCAYTSNAL